MVKIWEEIAELFRDKLRISISGLGSSYRKPYNHRFDTLPYPSGSKVSDFSNFSGESAKRTHDHIYQYLAYIVRRISRLAPSSINSWGDLECTQILWALFSGEYELELVDLASLQ